MSKKYQKDLIVFIGRFQPCHSSHIKIMERALQLGEHLVILIGSAGQPRTIKNPWSWQEREKMIRASLPMGVQERIVCVPLGDYMYNDQKWVKEVQRKVEQAKNSIQGKKQQFNIALIGHEKDDSSYYLKMFPQWEMINVDNIKDLHATDIRNEYFEMDTDNDQSLIHFEKEIGQYLPTGVHDFLRTFQLREEYDKLVQEYNFIKKYKESWANAPYPPTFVTVDGIVVQSGHLLLVQRRAEPGKGLWALPGGFINQNETLINAVIRELREETKLKVPEPVIKGSLKNNEVFDHPNRSLRGRTITHAYLFELQSGPLPKVKGGDDAAKAKWVPISMIDRMEDQMFEDHYQIIQHMIATL